MTVSTKRYKIKRYTLNQFKLRKKFVTIRL